MTTKIISSNLVNVKPQLNLNISLCSFEDCLNYLDYSINNNDGDSFKLALKVLKDKFNYGISTTYLKQFCNTQKFKNQHIAYMLKKSDYKTIKSTYAYKVFDLLITLEEFNKLENSLNSFKEKCFNEWLLNDGYFMVNDLRFKYADFLNDF